MIFHLKVYFCYSHVLLLYLHDTIDPFLFLFFQLGLGNSNISVLHITPCSITTISDTIVKDSIILLTGMVSPDQDIDWTSIISMIYIG